MAIGGKVSFLVVLQQNIATVLDEQMDSGDIDSKLDDLQKELLRLANSGSQYMDVTDEIYKLREMKQSALTQNADRHSQSQRITEMEAFLNSQIGVIGQYEDRLVRRLIERVKVSEGRVVVRFRSGTEVDVEI
jgi:site-specific DNA recombinase